MSRSAKSARTAPQLTERERQVLALITDGYSNEEAAIKLQLSRRTIEAHRARIMLKLNIDTLPGLVKYAIRVGITDLDYHRGKKF